MIRYVDRYSRVPGEILKWALMRKRVQKCIVIMWYRSIYYEGSCSIVCACAAKQDLRVRVCVLQGSTLSPLNLTLPVLCSNEWNYKGGTEWTLQNSVTLLRYNC